MSFIKNLFGGGRGRPTFGTAPNQSNFGPGAPPFPPMGPPMGPPVAPPPGGGPRLDALSNLMPMFTGGQQGLGYSSVPPKTPSSDGWKDWIRKPEVAAGIAQGAFGALGSYQDTRSRERQERASLEQRKKEFAAAQEEARLGRERQSEEDARRRRVAELLAPMLRGRLNQ
jgi:hypothetical protein